MDTFSEQTSYRVHLINALGEELCSSSIKNGEIATISSGQYPPGVYLVVLTSINPETGANDVCETKTVVISR